MKINKCDKYLYLALAMIPITILLVAVWEPLTIIGLVLFGWFYYLALKHVGD